MNIMLLLGQISTMTMHAGILFAHLISYKRKSLIPDSTVVIICLNNLRESDHDECGYLDLHYLHKYNSGLEGKCKTISAL